MSQSYLNGSVYIVEIIAILLEQQEGQECPQVGQRSSSCHLSQGQEDKGTQRKHQGAAWSYRHHWLGEQSAVKEIFFILFFYRKTGRSLKIFSQIWKKFLCYSIKMRIDVEKNNFNIQEWYLYFIKVICN